jgi:hypothetical protein
MILSWAAAGEQDTEPVVGQAAEASPGTLDLIDGDVGGFDTAVGGSGGVVGEDLGPPAGEGLGEGAQLRARHRIGAPGDRSIERCLGGVVVIGEEDVTDVLLGHPGVLNLAVEVAVAQRGVEAFPAGFVEAFGGHQQQLAMP